MEKRFNVFIVEDSTSKAVSLIGENLREDKAELREETGWRKVDTNRFTPVSVEVGSDKDKKFQKDLEK